MFAWISWNICYCIYSMVMRVFWLLVDDYWLSWCKDLISNFPLLSFFVFLLACLPVLIHQLQNTTIPPLPSPLELTADQLSNTPTFEPAIEGNITGVSRNTSTTSVNRNIKFSDQTKMNLDNVIAPVIGKEFCSSSQIELVIAGKTEKSIFDNFCVKDGNGNEIFRIEEGESCFHVRRILVDAAGNSIVSMEKKITSTHRRWEVYKGDGRHIEDLLFITKKTSAVQLRTKLEVYLASNANEAICDFIVQGRGFEQLCQIYGAGHSGLLAQMNKDLTSSVGNAKYIVTVYPNIDYAFIVTLIFILDSVNNVLRFKD